MNREIFIATHTLSGGMVVITAYTSEVGAKTACQDAAAEFGITEPLKWQGLTARYPSVTFSIFHRFLNGVSE